MAARLDRSRIVAEALLLLEEGGLDAVSLRRIAGRLGVGVSTLYWHVKDKDELLLALSQTIFRRCLDAVGNAKAWEDWLTAFGNALWAAQIAIPDTRKLIVLVTPDAHQRSRIEHEILEALEQRGMPRGLGGLAQRSVQALVTGWTTLDAASNREDTSQFQQALQALISGWRVSAQQT